MDLKSVLFYIFIALAVALGIFMGLGIINEDPRQIGAATIFFGICLLFIAFLKRKST